MSSEGEYHENEMYFYYVACLGNVLDCDNAYYLLNETWSYLKPLND